MPCSRQSSGKTNDMSVNCPTVSCVSHLLKVTVAVSLLMAFPARVPASDHSGVVRGVVIDAVGNPVAAARVKATYTGAFDGIVPSATSDSSGQFVIEHLPFGKYYVTASKEQDGYPDQSNPFYTGFNSHLVTVELDSNQPEQNVTVWLGERAGLIFGTVVDAETHEPLQPWAELRWKDEPSIFLSGTGLIASSFRLLVPANTTLSLVVCETGYEPWFYRNQDSNHSLRLAQGQESKLEIAMKPNGDKNKPLSDEELKAMSDLAAKGGGCPTPSRLP